MVFWQRMNSVAMPVLMTFGLAGSLMVSWVSHFCGLGQSAFTVHGVAASVHVAGGPTSGTVCPVMTALGDGSSLTNW